MRWKPGLLIAVPVVLVVGVVTWIALLPHPDGEHPVGSGPLVVAAPTAMAPAPEPEPTPTETVHGTLGRVVEIDPEWLARVAAATSIPQRALQAYAQAALAVSRSCGLGWNTLAAIGYEESRHGSHGGATLEADGTESVPIIGIAIDGNGAAAGLDSDDGKLDGDKEADHALGPMQLVPDSWRNWRSDGNGDGVKDPQNIDDATLTAARYLCRAGDGLRTDADWVTAIRAYNHDDDYVAHVSADASYYAKAAGG